MFTLSLRQAMSSVGAEGNTCCFPEKKDPRVRHGSVFPRIVPRFKISRGAAVFTLGSCFARHIEDSLGDFRLPMKQFSVPESERPWRPNGILNEYNPGTMCQRVELALERATFGDRCIEEVDGGFIDLLLAEYTTPTSMERVMERRAQVDQVYATLAECEAAIVTLGLVEAWYDHEAGLYLNRMPSWERKRSSGARYEFRLMDVEDAYPLVERLAKGLVALGVRKIIMTVSPVPLEVTFSQVDCTSANLYSKSVLVVCAQRVSREMAEVAYFPSFEIATSGGLDAYTEDAHHLKDEVVERISGYMIDNYIETPTGAADGTLSVPT